MPLPGELVSRTGAFRFPWRPGNRILLLRDAQQFYPAMRTAIHGATESILLELYLVQSGRIARAFVQDLCDARARGVRVLLLLDSFGALGFQASDRRRLTQAGVLLRFYNPLRFRYPFRNLARDHRKIMLIDGSTAFVGGAGISDVFLRKDRRERGWRELMLQIHGPVLQDWHTLFRETWAGAGGFGEDVPAMATPPAEGFCLGRVTCTQRLIRQEVRNSMLREIKRSKHYIWLATAYFLPSWTIRRALRAAVHRGVDVRLLLPGNHSDHPSVTIAGRRYYTRLLRAGVRIYEYQPRFLHMKAIIIDDWMSAGSCNMDHWTLRWTLEANQEIRDSRLAAEVREMFEEDFAQAREIVAQRWQERSWAMRLLERLVGWLDRLLTRIGN